MYRDNCKRKETKRIDEEYILVSLIIKKMHIIPETAKRDCAASKRLRTAIQGRLSKPPSGLTSRHLKPLK